SYLRDLIKAAGKRDIDRAHGLNREFSEAFLKESPTLPEDLQTSYNSARNAALASLSEENRGLLKIARKIFSKIPKQIE
ncbi:MAG: hypothetical protein NT076_03370, partial [Candidatus Pacearchaeota archaeon]|nr:hypothetical protein [Candidatus Pacearchaeota archaeon]